MFWILLILAVSASIFLYIKYFKYWERKGVKQGLVWPIVGDSIQNLRGKSFSELTTAIYNKEPNLRYYGVYQYHIPALMIKDPNLIRLVGVKDFEHFLDHRPFLADDADPLWNKNLFALRGKRWREMRSTLSPSFTGSKMRIMFHLMHKCAENFVKNLAEKSEETFEVNLKELFTRYSNDIIATTAFGVQVDSLKDPENEFYVRGRQTTDFSGLWKIIKLNLCVLIPILSKVLKPSLFDKEASAFFRNLVKETIDYRENNRIERQDMINLLMHARKETQKEDETETVEENNFAAVEEHIEPKIHKGKIDLSLDDIASQALLFFFAGFDTVANGMCFMSLELASNPDIQERLREEIENFRSTHSSLTYEGLTQLPYLDMVLSETLRKWPNNIIIDRQCTKPYTIQPENPGEKPVQLKYPDTLWIPVYAIHRDPKFWPNPEKFDPERFSHENKGNIVPYTYLPFGFGPRNCIGSRFALAEIKALFYALLPHFEIIPVERSCIPFAPDPKSFVLAPAKGFWFAFKKRQMSK